MRRWAAVALASGLLALAWVTLAPPALGGSVSYVVTSGTSMRPRIHAGDLVLVRRADRYAVGQVVAYRSASLHRVVLHRIVGRDVERFVVKGDNNSWVDVDRPHPAAIIGRSWGRLPGAGRILGSLRRPAVALGLVAGLSLAALGIGRRRRGKRSRGSPPPGRPGGALGPAIAASIAAALAVGLSALAVIAYSSPTRRTVAGIASYRQSGRFDYVARASGGTVYPGGRVSTGDPIFLNLVRTLGLRFSYALEAPGPLHVGGNARLDLELSGGDGWTRVIPIRAQTSFTGDRFTVSGTVDLDRIRSLVLRVEELTGIRRDAYGLSVVPRIEMAGDLDGRPFAASFAPRLAFRLDALEAQLDRSGDPASAVLEPVATGSLGVERTVPNRLSFVGGKIPVGGARSTGAVGAALCALVAAAFARRLRRVSTDEAASIRRRLAPWIVPAHGLAPEPEWVEVESVEGLIRIADASGGPVLVEERDDEHVFALRDGGLWYAYRLRATPSSNGRGGVSREAGRG